MYAQFLYSKQRAQLDLRESAQEVQHIHCNELSYTIFSPVENNHTILFLTAVKRSITDKIVTQQISESRRERVEDIPVYVRVNLMPCPPGFLLSTSFHKKCDCNNQLRPLLDVACNIQYSTLQRRGLVWIGPELNKYL